MGDLRKFLLIALAGLFIHLAAQPAWACLWDHDTLMMERQRFPDTLELITGKFIHHSEAYYHWRIKDRQRRLQASPNDMRLLDDLAVAYIKTDQPDKAIAIAKAQLKQQPERYETLSNLGTFYMLQGRWKEGLPYINEALKINPDAYFGRERYQKYLAEYMITDYPKRLSTTPEFYDLYHDKNSHGFFQFLCRKGVIKEGSADKDIDLALKGVKGMIRFGDPNAPILMDALGSLLINYGDPASDARLLASRAFLKASYYSSDKKTKRLYRQYADAALQTQGNSDSVATEMEFQSELKDAELWLLGLENDEKRWIAENKNTDAEFERKYYLDPFTFTGLNAFVDWLSLQLFNGYSWLIILTVVFTLKFLFRPKKIPGDNQSYLSELKAFFSGKASPARAFWYYLILDLIFFSIPGLHRYLYSDDFYRNVARL